MPLLKKLIPPLIILWAFSSLFFISTSNFKLYKNKLLFFSLIFYYLLFIISFLWTDNIKNGFIYLESGLSFLVFPIIFVLTRSSKCKNVPAILFSFILGNIIAILFNIARAIIRISRLEMPFNFELLFNTQFRTIFTYAEFSFFQHPSYASMYTVFAIVTVFYLVVQLNRSKKYLLTLVLFFPSIFLYSSKVGIFSLFLIILFIILISIIKYKKVLVSTIILFLLTFVFVIFAKNNERINAFIYHKKFNFDKKNNSITTDPRIFIWQSNIDLVKENLLLGTGIGDYKDEIAKVYTKNEYKAGLEKKYNAHNQFLENFASLGILGFLNLLILLVAATLISIKERRVLELAFLAIIGTNLLFESMFDKQAGTIFFVFFFSYFFFSNYSEKNIVK